MRKLVCFSSPPVGGNTEHREVLTPAASAEFTPAPDADPVREPGRGRLHLFGGVLFDSLSSARRRRTSQDDADAVETIQRYARVLILEEGDSRPKTAIIAGVEAIKPHELDLLDEDPAADLVATSNIAASHVLHDEAEVCEAIRQLEFQEHVEKQDSLEFLLTNLVAKSKGASFNLFTAYFAPGHDVNGVGVYLNTWL